MTKIVKTIEKIAEHFGVKSKQLLYVPGTGWYYGEFSPDPRRASYSVSMQRILMIRDAKAVFVGKSYYEIQYSPSWTLKKLP